MADIDRECLCRALEDAILLGSIILPMNPHGQSSVGCPSVSM